MLKCVRLPHPQLPKTKDVTLFDFPWVKFEQALVSLKKIADVLTFAIKQNSITKANSMSELLKPL